MRDFSHRHAPDETADFIPDARCFVLCLLQNAADLPAPGIRPAARTVRRRIPGFSCACTVPEMLADVRRNRSFPYPFFEMSLSLKICRMWGTPSDETILSGNPEQGHHGIGKIEVLIFKKTANMRFIRRHVRAVPCTHGTARRRWRLWRASAPTRAAAFRP